MFLKSVFSKRDVEHVLEERVLEQHVVVDVAVAQLSAEPAALLQIVDADVLEERPADAQDDEN